MTLKRLTKVLTAIACVGITIFFLSRYRVEAISGAAASESQPVFSGIPQDNFVEHSFYNTGTGWIAGAFQCEIGGDVVFLSEPNKQNGVRYHSFKKSNPESKEILHLSQVSEPECGMMKCYTQYRPVGRKERFEVFDSNYIDVENSWHHAHGVGKGPTADAAHDALQNCRYVERTRAILMTDKRSIYVSESESGDLEYRSFDYEAASENPSLMLKGGKAEHSNGRNTFTFTNEGYKYIVAVSTTPKPFVELIVKKGDDVAAREHIRQYTYVKKPKG
jgi:hypothetical protein